MRRHSIALAAAALLIAGCQSPPPPAAPPAAVQPAAPRPDPTAKALESYKDKLDAADTDGMITAVRYGGGKGAAEVQVPDDWALLPAPTRESIATDLYKIWDGDWVKAGGDSDSAQLFVVNRHGKTLVHAAPGMMRVSD